MAMWNLFTVYICDGVTLTNSASQIRQHKAKEAPNSDLWCAVSEVARQSVPFPSHWSQTLEWKIRQRCQWIKERLNPTTMFVCSHFQGSKAETLYFYKLAAQTSRRTCLRASTTRRLWSRGARRRLCPPGCSHQAFDRSNPRRKTSSVTSAAMQRTENRTLMSTTETYT